MAIRATLSAFVARPAARVLAKPLRELVEEALAARRFATAEDLADLRRRVEQVRNAVVEKSNPAAMAEEVAALKKKLNMAMGALQAATAQMAETRKVSEEALHSARQAQAQAASALTTAESAAEGAQQLEMELEASPAPTAAAATAEPSCAVPGCTSPHRARGFCGKHYQQWKRGSLEGFPKN